MKLYNPSILEKELLELVKIVAPSGKEKPVRGYLIAKLKAENLVDSFHVDKKGNLLGIKKCGTGEGATVILSSHMDSVSNLAKDRKIVHDKNTGTVHTTDGVLGADDRAGIAIILSVLRNIPKEFNGTIKVAFSVEEEMGCVGAREIPKEWTEGANLAIVVDRRGNRDIVTGTWGTPFCAGEVGDFFEELYPKAGWKATDGGISDACIFSERGINSVNLSAGYYNEHTTKEFVVFTQMYDTRDLVIKALTEINNHYQEWGEVPAPAPMKYYYNYHYGYDSDERINSVLGDIDINLTRSNFICIKQMEYGEVWLTEDDTYELIDLLYNYLDELTERSQTLEY